MTDRDITLKMSDDEKKRNNMKQKKNPKNHNKQGGSNDGKQVICFAKLKTKKDPRATNDEKQSH